MLLTYILQRSTITTPTLNIISKWVPAVRVSIAWIDVQIRHGVKKTYLTHV